MDLEDSDEREQVEMLYQRINALETRLVKQEVRSSTAQMEQNDVTYQSGVRSIKEMSRRHSFQERVLAEREDRKSRTTQFVRSHTANSAKRSSSPLPQRDRTLRPQAPRAPYHMRPESVGKGTPSSRRRKPPQRPVVSLRQQSPERPTRFTRGPERERALVSEMLLRPIVPIDIDGLVMPGCPAFDEDEIDDIITFWQKGGIGEAPKPRTEYMPPSTQYRQQHSSNYAKPTSARTFHDYGHAHLSDAVSTGTGFTGHKSHQPRSSTNFLAQAESDDDDQPPRRSKGKRKGRHRHRELLQRFREEQKAYLEYLSRPRKVVEAPLNYVPHQYEKVDPKMFEWDPFTGRKHAPGDVPKKSQKKSPKPWDVTAKKKKITPGDPEYPTQTIAKTSEKFVQRQKILREGEPTKKDPRFEPYKWPEYGTLQRGEVLLSVEHCVACSRHNMSLRHNEAEFVERAKAVCKAVADELGGGRFPVRFGAVRFGPRGLRQFNEWNAKTAGQLMKQNDRLPLDIGERLGAFEVQLAFHSPRSQGGLHVFVVFSKLKDRCFPVPSVIAQKVVKELLTHCFPERTERADDFPCEPVSNDIEGHVDWYFDARPTGEDIAALEAAMESARQEQLEAEPEEATDEPQQDVDGGEQESLTDKVEGSQPTESKEKEQAASEQALSNNESLEDMQQKQQEELRQWLQRVHSSLLRYLPSLVDEGYDSLDAVSLMKGSDVVRLQGMKRGHANLMIAGLRQLRHERGDESPTEQEEDAAFRAEMGSISARSNPPAPFQQPPAESPIESASSSSLVLGSGRRRSGPNTAPSQSTEAKVADKGAPAAHKPGLGNKPKPTDSKDDSSNTEDTDDENNAPAPLRQNISVEQQQPAQDPELIASTQEKRDSVPRLPLEDVQLIIPAADYDNDFDESLSTKSPDITPRSLRPTSPSLVHAHKSPRSGRSLRGSLTSPATPNDTKPDLEGSTMSEMLGIHEHTPQLQTAESTSEKPDFNASTMSEMLGMHASKATSAESSPRVLSDANNCNDEAEDAQSSIKQPDDALHDAVIDEPQDLQIISSVQHRSSLLDIFADSPRQEHVLGNSDTVAEESLTPEPELTEEKSNPPQAHPEEDKGHTDALSQGASTDKAETKLDETKPVGSQDDDAYGDDFSSGPSSDKAETKLAETKPVGSQDDDAYGDDFSSGPTSEQIKNKPDESKPSETQDEDAYGDDFSMDPSSDQTKTKPDTTKANDTKDEDDAYDDDFSVSGRQSQPSPPSHKSSANEEKLNAIPPKSSLDVEDSNGEDAYEEEFPDDEDTKQVNAIKRAESADEIASVEDENEHNKKPLHKEPSQAEDAYDDDFTEDEKEGKTIHKEPSKTEDAYDDDFTEDEKEVQPTKDRLSVAENSGEGYDDDFDHDEAPADKKEGAVDKDDDYEGDFEAASFSEMNASSVFAPNDEQYKMAQEIDRVQILRDAAQHEDKEESGGDSLLIRNPSEYSALTEITDASKMEPSLVVAKRLRKRLQRIAQQLSSGLKSGLQMLFAMLDSDGSGTLESAEFKRTLKELGLRLDRKESEAVLACFDTNGDGTINFKEFARFVLSDPVGEEIGYLWEKIRKACEQSGADIETLDCTLFEKYANQENKYEISEEDFAKALNEIEGLSLSQSDLEQLIVHFSPKAMASISRNQLPTPILEEEQCGSRKVNYWMFSSWISPVDVLKLSKRISRFLRSVGDDGEDNDDEPKPPGHAEKGLLKLFQQMDEDGSGDVDLGELKKMINSLGLPITDAEARALIIHFDSDGDGRICFEEFAKLVDKPKDTSPRRRSLNLRHTGSSGKKL